MTTILVPYHQDERLPAGHIPVPGDELGMVFAGLPAGDLWPRLTYMYNTLADSVASEVADSVAGGGGGGPTVISGDCLVALGTVAGVQRAGLDPAVVWFDAHGDVHTLHTTTSGYLGGLSLRLVLGEHPELIAEPLGLRPVPQDRTVLVGARDLDPAEAQFLAESSVRRLPVEQVHTGLLPDGPIVLHVDVDVIDSGDLPGLLFPAAGGPSADAVIAACQRVVDTGRVVAVDIACPWGPAADEAAREARAALVARLIWRTFH